MGKQDGKEPGRPEGRAGLCIERRWIEAEGVGVANSVDDATGESRQAGVFAQRPVRLPVQVALDAQGAAHEPDCRQFADANMPLSVKPMPRSIRP